jgi:hypothetical protein
MAGTSRALTLKLLADIDNFTKNINKADNEVATFGDKITKFGKIAGKAFLLAGAAAVAYAGKLAIDGVKAAIEDEKANALLANTLRNVAGATDETIKKTLAYTRATELATGVTEDELRPSLNRLVIATGNVQKAMNLQTLALNVSAGSGKSLNTVTQALAKAQEGNTASLGRLGVGLTAAQLKTMSMEEITQSLADTFEGASATAADTYEGKMKRLGLAFEDVRDTVGGFILDAITPMVEDIVSKVMPALANFADSLTGGSSLKNAFSEIIRVAKTLLIPIFEGIKKIFDTVKKAVSDNEEAFTGLWKFISTVLAPFLGGAFKIVLSGIAIAIGVVVTAVGKLISAFQILFEWGRKVKEFLGFGSSGASNINMTASTPSRVPSMASPSFAGGFSGQAINYNNNITVNGAIDPISTARQINQVLGNAATSSGSFLNLGLSNAVYV